MIRDLSDENLKAQYLYAAKRVRLFNTAYYAGLLPFYEREMIKRGVSFTVRQVAA